MTTAGVQIRLATGDLEFPSPIAFFEWLTSEAIAWESLSRNGGGGADPIGNAGNRGASSHAGEWRRLASQAQEATQQPELNVRARIDAVRQKAQDEIERGELIVSTSEIGAMLLGIAAHDPEAAKIGVCLAAGRLVGELAGSGRLPLFRVIPRLLAARASASSESLLSRASEAANEIQQHRANSAEARAAIDEELQRARQLMEVEGDQRQAQLEDLIQALDEKANDQIHRVDEHWRQMVHTMEQKLALSAPATYWRDRKATNWRFIVLWGVATLFVVSLIGFWFLPMVKLSLEAVRSLPTGQTVSELGWVAALPEIVGSTIVAFLFLWALRFCVRQFAENLYRAEDAAQRLTMLNTFLALMNPEEGRSPVVAEADRALIVAALFRPSGANAVDDGPPSHWIEDVLARLKGKT